MAVSELSRPALPRVVAPADILTGGIGGADYRDTWNICQEAPADRRLPPAQHAFVPRVLKGRYAAACCPGGASERLCCALP